jgi:hypothetical protein
MFDSIRVDEIGKAVRLDDERVCAGKQRSSLYPEDVPIHVHSFVLLWASEV